MKVTLVNLIDEDFSNYKEATMTIGFPFCTFKCGREHCQNAALADAEKIDVDAETLVDRYLQNPITSAICFQGLEPFDSPEMFDLIEAFRARTDDMIVIYSGYTLQETCERGWANRLMAYHNITVKYGRYIPGQEPHYDSVLGINLASDNQYAEVVSGDPERV